LSRLNQGRRHLEHDTVEAAAIEFGISAEALLTQDRDANAPISFILRARGTLLLGGTSDERKDNYRTLRDLYDLRSTVAHEGSIVDVGTSPLSASAREKLQQAIKKARLSEQVCTDLITAIIRRGNFPDWDQLMFGW
jgi:ribosomal protein S18